MASQRTKSRCRRIRVGLTRRHHAITRAMAAGEGKSKRGPAPWKITLWAILVAGLLGALADVLTGANRVASAWGELRATLTNVFGPAPHEVTTPFETVGPYASVGCDESRASSVDFTAPTD